MRVVYVTALFTGPAFLAFGLSIAKEKKLLWGADLVLLSYVIGIAFLPVLFSSLLIKDVRTFLPYFAVVPGLFYPIFIAFFSATCGYSFWRLWSVFRLTKNIRRNQIKYVFIAYSLAFFSAVFHFGSAYGLKELFPHDFLVIACMALMAYAILKYRLMDIRVAALRTIVFVLVYIPILMTPFIAGVIFRGFLEDIFKLNWWMLPAIGSSILAPLGLYVYFNIKNKAEALLLKEQRRYQQALIQISETMTLIKELDKLLDLIVQKVKTLVGIKDVCLFVDDKTGQYTLKTSGYENGFPKDLRFSSKDPIIQYLIEHRSPIIREEIMTGKSASGREGSLEVISSLMHRYGIALIIPSFVQDSLLGFMTLGEKSDGRMYSQDDLDVFEALANQAALAIENAVFYEEQGKSLAQELQEHKLKYLGNMASNMCHELSNRFNGVTANTFLIFDQILPRLKKLLETSPDPKTRDELLNNLEDVLKKIDHHAFAGGETVDRFRQNARQAKIETLDIVPLIENSLSLVTTPKEKAGDIVKIIPKEEYGLEIHIPSDFPKLAGEVFSLENALGNMLRNACAAQEKKKESIKKDGIPVESYSPKVIISARVVNGTAVIAVIDNGIGMTKNELNQMFVPFFTTKVKGTGVGLSILKTMIELQGGKVSVESEHLKGTTFTISLPTAKEGSL